VDLDAAAKPRGYWPALDGLRGIAILLVFAFHLPLKVFRAGSFGVILFFVLSGFLISTIILRELDEKGSLSFRHFYLRRARRLLPALGIVVVAHLILQLTVLDEPHRWWARTWPVLAYVSNYGSIAGMSMGHMAHTWSLAIEEHFYLLWPLSLVLMPRRLRFRMTVSLAVGFIIWRSGLLLAGVPDIRIYFGTDTNAFAPLLGCALAVGYRENRLPAPAPNQAALSIAAVLFAASLPLHYSDRRVLWATVPVALLSVVALHAALSSPPAWLENPVLRWFGMISYGLYLWHYMVISLLWDRLPIPELYGMIATPIAAAWLSWRFVEAPLLRARRCSKRREDQATMVNREPSGRLRP
jgi:peptidoglycan/LPS O-acetylase OafA/YrhL